jgi:hypothetical protein
MVRAKAINIMDEEAIFSKQVGHVEKTERFGPKIMRRKIINPGVDEEDIKGFSFHKNR